jgi:hypothetical protein
MMLEDCPVRFIICWISIEKSIDCYAVERETPTLRRRIEGMVGPFAPIIFRFYRSFVLVQVIADMIGMPPQCTADAECSE